MRVRNSRAGLTLVELIVAFTIMLILSTMALPLARIKVAREKERRLRDALSEMRKAIDRYKDAADQGLLGELDPDNHGYPESLEMLVEGVDTTGGGMGAMGMGGMGMGGMGSGMGGMNQRSGFGNQSSGSFGNRSSGFGSQSGFGGQSGFGNRSGFGSQRQSGFGSQSRSGFGNQRSGFGSQQRDRGFGDEEGADTLRFLRKIPVDPITGRAEWGMRSISDDPGSMSWGGRNVFDVFSLSMDTALDGTRYSDW